MELGSGMRMKSRSIIGWALALLAALVLAGCSVLRIGYSQAPMLAYFWIDGFVDINEAQRPPLRESIDRWFDWHRRTEMPRYAALLVRAQREVMEPRLTTDQLCAWRDEAQRRLDAALDEATPAIAALMVSLTPEQIRHMERKLAKDGEELRNDFAQADRSERAQGAFKRTLERYENLYGRLDDTQRGRLAELLASSPFDADRWLTERERRNRDLIATLTSVAAGGRAGTDRAAALAQGQAAVHVLAERFIRSPRPEYRAYQQRLTQENCALAAAMHNLTTPAQRLYARDKLKGWENEVRLIVNGNGAPADAAAINPR
jgi:Family of unknown function (DUF6279)